MKFAVMYLIGFLVLVSGILAALWKTSVLAAIGPVWVMILVVIAIGIGIMVAVSFSGAKENIDIHQK